MHINIVIDFNNNDNNNNNNNNNINKNISYNNINNIPEIMNGKNSTFGNSVFERADVLALTCLTEGPQYNRGSHVVINVTLSSARLFMS